MGKFIISIQLIFCIWDNSSYPQNQTEQLQIQVYAPDGCFSEFELFYNNTAMIKKGTYHFDSFYNRNIIDSSHISIDSIQIAGSKVQKKIYRAADKIKNEKYQSSSFRNDAFEFHVLSNGNVNSKAIGLSPSGLTIVKELIKQNKNNISYCGLDKIFQ